MLGALTRWFSLLLTLFKVDFSCDARFFGVSCFVCFNFGIAGETGNGNRGGAGILAMHCVFAETSGATGNGGGIGGIVDGWELLVSWS